MTADDQPLAEPGNVAPDDRAHRDDFRVRIFTLADHAAAPPDGKLYIAGAGVDRIVVLNPQAPLPPFFVVGRIGLPYTMASEPHHVTVRLLDADRNPVLPAPAPDPLVDFTGETGRPAGFRPEDETAIQFAVGLNGLPSRRGVLFFHLAVDGQQLTTLPLRIMMADHPGQQPR